MAETILIVDDEKSIRDSLGGSLEDNGYSVLLAEDGETALKIVSGGDPLPDVIILDIWMGNDKEAGFKVLAELGKTRPGIPVVMFTGHGDIETAVRAMKKGAFNFLEKPSNVRHILIVLKKALEWKELSRQNLLLASENKLLKSRTLLLDELYVGESGGMAELMATLEKVAPTKTPVLITGENGVGKELAAKTLHALSKQAQKRMVSINCASLPDTLIESALFGHEKGAFTGAERQKQGIFDQADNSTLFLDEIGDMSEAAQAKILRVLETQEFQRVGGEKSVSVNVRFVSASNKNLEEEMERRKFRRDLYHRLNGVTVTVPPLRERREDIPGLAEMFLEKCVQSNGLPPLTLGPRLLEDLKNRRWPGNVRELKNTVERLAILAREDVIDSDPLPGAGAENRAPENGSGFSELLDRPYKEAKAEFDAYYFNHHYRKNNQNAVKTASFTGVDRTTVHKKLKPRKPQ
jgi:two-component system nitrogen regulation response regulator NtrX